MSKLLHSFGRYADLALVVIVLGILLVLFTPIPTPVLDTLILVNVSFALLILLMTFYIPRPVEFSTFPSMLLIATLFRLSLNVAATRLILSQGDAGKVIGAIGSYVVQGNYVIGIIVFLILIVVQYVVVTSGAQRVSEVAARFTLDSMPGQQMSIDADLNMGFIDQAEAQKRRKNLEKEAAFYGAMDGASKFVKGDAVAGILILLVDIVGGLVVGVVQGGLPWDQALQNYTLLTIGDGIVTQVPALVIAVGTGIIVTRSASDENLSGMAIRQLSAFPRTIALVGCALAGLALLPGIPVLPAMSIVLVLAAAFWFARKAAHGRDAPNTALGDEPTGDTDPYKLLPLEAVSVTVGADLIDMSMEESGPVKQRIGLFRKQFALESGLVLPGIVFGSGAKLGGAAYEISIFGVPVARGELVASRLLAIHPSGDVQRIAGMETRDPTYGLPALWIEEETRQVAMAARYTVIDPITVFMTHVTETLRREASTLLTRAETERLLGQVRESQPGLVEELVPALLSLSDIQKVMQALLREKVSIRNLDAILETLADSARQIKDIAQLTELVRQRLGHAICHSLLSGNAALQVMTLDPQLESRLTQMLNGSAERLHTMDPALADTFLKKMAQSTEQMLRKNMLPVLLCSQDIRRHLRLLTERALPQLRVISVAEIPRSMELKSFCTIGA